jgi:SulP family sulfate permease
MLQPKILTTLKTYDMGQAKADILAGVTVAMVAIPLSVAIAIASGADPATGLVTAIVGGFVISALGGSRVQIGGPTGAFIVVVASIIAVHGYDGLVMATMMAGLILIVVGWLRGGNLIELVPEPVINGFTIGIGFIIATSQLKDLFGLVPGHDPVDFIDKIAALWQVRGTVNWSAFVAGAITMVLIVALRRVAPRLPALIIAVSVVSAVVALSGLQVETIGSRFGDLPRGLPIPRLPHFSWDRLRELFPSAVIIAFLAAIESLLSAVVADRMIGGKHRPNAEVVAQGFANIASSLFGGLPATGAIARTATNVRAGGKTPVAGIVHALTILLVMLIAAPLAGYLAMPSLAALLILTAWNMSEPHKWAGYLQARRSDAVLVVLTLILTVTVSLSVAIGVGVTVGLALRLRRRDVPPATWDPRDG